MKEIPIVCPSHKRADKVLTKNVIPNIRLCVAESQVDDYARHNPGIEIVPHPDTVVGISPKRQWIYEKFGDVYMVDDDIIGVSRVYMTGFNRKLRLTPTEVHDLIQDTYRICRDANIHLFGFSGIAHPVAYNGGKPIRMNVYVAGGSFGIMEDPNLYFPDIPDFVGEDAFICALNAYFNRRLWQDCRFAFNYAQTEMGRGGCADFRTEEIRKKHYYTLKKFFGNAIIRKPKSNPKIRTRKSEWERLIIFPY